MPLRRALAFLLATSPAFAQVDTARARRDTAFLAPTTVTVVRTTMDVREAPYAIGVTTRDEIQRGKPGLALDEALAGIAGVQVDNRFNYALGERISIRGFGARAQFGVRGVRVILDGIPMTLADGQTSLNNVDVTTLNRAEVIRGPASTLHGNAAGGVIQLESAVADIDDARPLGGWVRTDAGEHGLLRQQLSIGGHRDSTSITVSGSRMFYQGFRQWNDATNDHVSLLVRRGTSLGALTVSGNWVEYNAKNPGGLDAGLLASNRDTVSPTNYNNRTGERGRQAQAGVSWNQRVAGFAMLASAHALGRQVDNPIPFNIVVVDRDAGGARFSLAKESAIGLRSWRLGGGAEAQLQHDDRRNYGNNAGARGAVTLDQFERVDNIAAFLLGSVDLAPRLVLSIGARHDYVRFRVTDHLVDVTNPDESGERPMRAWSPSAGLVWLARPSLDVYGNYSTSFETPTTSELANQPSGAGGMNPTLEPQRTRSAEIGVRHRFAVGSIGGSAELSLYAASVRDALIPFQLVPGGRQFFQNAGSTTNRGIEAAVHAVFPASLSLRAAYAHTDARFEEISVTRAAVTTVHNGKRVPGVASNRADATLSIQPAQLFFDWETRISSSITVDNANSQRSPSYVVHSLRAGHRGVEAAGVVLQPSIGVLNLFEKEYNSSVVVNANGGRFFEPGPPRSVYGGMSVRF